MSQLSNVFSECVREDIIKSTWKSGEELRAELSGACYTLDLFGRMQNNTDHFLIIQTGSNLVLHRMKLLLESAGLQVVQKESNNPQGKASLHISSEQKTAFINALYPINDELCVDQLISMENLRRSFLRGAFLVAGSVSNPEKMYRIEMTIRNDNIVKTMMLFFHAQNLTPSVISRENRVILYLRDSEQIADFLAFIGAHRSRVRYEDIRTEKEIRNQVNRVVNCDTANALRQSEAGYARSSRIQKLMCSPHVIHVPDELRSAASVLLDNPGSSLRELGQLMQPPISKSGMHHRLKKLENFAKENGLE